MAKSEIGTTTAQVGSEEYKNVTGTDIDNSKRALDVVSRDFLFQISQGNIPNHTIETIFGHNATVETTEETIWPESTLYTWPTSASILTLSSSDANDTSAGTGLRTVLIQGLDADYAKISEIVTLNGQSGVNTVNDYLRVNKLIGLTAGSGGKNAGIVYAGTGTITTGKPATVVNLIPLGANISQSGFYTIPASHSGHVVQANYAGIAGKFMTLFSYERSFGGIFLRTSSFNLQDSNVTLTPLTPPSKLTEKSDNEFRGLIDVQTGDIKVAVSLVLVNTAG